MEYWSWSGSNLSNYSSSFFLSAFVLLLILKWRKAKHGVRQPPGPPGWPLIGNILDLGARPHQKLYDLRGKYGPIIWLRLGSVNTIVIQSAQAAAELFKNHDLPFSDRKVPDSLTACNYNEGTFAFSPYGAYWRVLRRLYITELLVTKRVNDNADMRQNCVDRMVQWIEDNAAASRERGGSGEVQISNFLLLMSFNLVGKLILSRDLGLDSKSEEGPEFFNAMEAFMELAGKPNLADFFPFLKWLDPSRIKRDMVREMGRTIKIVERYVKERVEEREMKREKYIKQDLLDVLLDYRGDGKEGPDKISERNIVIAIMELFFAGTETTSSTIEWAMVELINMPDSMRKAKKELDQVVGPTRKVQETDFKNLPYLEAVVKETLRLHPSLPLLVPRNAMCDTDYMGFLIPKGTQVFVNAWAIGRDSESWDDPLLFKPERFLGSNVDFKGQNFQFIPFGSGRRICVGYSLASRIMMLVLATLLHSFDWEVLDTSNAKDMSERVGITLRKLIPLKLVLKSRTTRSLVQ